MGAEVLEFHVVFDKLMFGPDSKSSLTIPEVKLLVEGANKIYESIQFPLDKDDELDNSLKIIFGKTLAINKNKKKGEIIKIDDLETKKPAKMGVCASEYQKVLNRKLNRDLLKGDFLRYIFFEK